MKDKLIKLTLAAALVVPFVSVGPQAVVQADDSVLEFSLDEPQNDDGSTFGVASIPRLIEVLFQTALIVAILFVFAMLILGGYGWITAGGDKTKVEEARTRITNAIIGLAIIASAWALITVLAQFFGVDFTNISIPSAAEEGTAAAS